MLNVNDVHTVLVLGCWSESKIDSEDRKRRDDHRRYSGQFEEDQYDRIDPQRHTSDYSNSLRNENLAIEEHLHLSEQQTQFKYTDWEKRQRRFPFNSSNFEWTIIHSSSQLGISTYRGGLRYFPRWSLKSSEGRSRKGYLSRTIARNSKE